MGDKGGYQRSSTQPISSTVHIAQKGTTTELKHKTTLQSDIIVSNKQKNK
jgi:hypothetical protein